jgi:hypothetical protein
MFDLVVLLGNDLPSLMDTAAILIELTKPKSVLRVL